MLISFVGIVLFERQHLISMLVLSIALFAFVEAGFRGRLVNLVSSANIGLAVVATLVILYEFFWQLVVAAVLSVGLYIPWDNPREIRRGAMLRTMRPPAGRSRGAARNTRSGDARRPRG